MQKRMFKVMTRVEKKGGGGYWMRVGSGFENKDASFNILLEAMPKSFELHMRELDEEDLRKRESHARGANGNGAHSVTARSQTPDAVPF
ncbi:MAG: hypothetical protein H6Q90_383 [Deltaproteobacteria bacterium]|nr:hypothetical protein [Deltaproteobacteria bacterium]